LGFGLLASLSCSVSDDRFSLAALVHFKLLEHLELIADDGGMTILGNDLKDSPRHLQEPCFVSRVVSEMARTRVHHEGQLYKDIAEFGEPALLSLMARSNIAVRLPHHSVFFTLVP